MTNSRGIDYVNTYFDSPVLTRIHGEPTYESLKVLKKQLQSNAASVNCALGGGANGHLGLVLTVNEYVRVCNDAYIRQVMPAPLVIPNNTAQHESIRLKAEHDERFRLYNEATDVDRALKRQLAQALDQVYVKGFRDSVTNQVQGTIPFILEELFSIYGYVEPEILAELETKTRDMHYMIHDPIVSIFNEIEDLRDLAVAARNPYTETQLIFFTLEIIRKSTEFEDALTKWEVKLDDEKTWENLKVHFRTGHLLLRKLRGKTMRQAGFQTANNLATRVMSELSDLETRVMNAIEEREPPIPTPPPPPPTPSHIEQPTEQAFAMNTFAPGMMELMERMSARMDAMELATRNTNTNTTTTNNNNSQRYTRTNTSDYCWTHGACAHKSKVCTRKRSGHKDNATLANKMGGSTYYCN